LCALALNAVESSEVEAVGTSTARIVLESTTGNGDEESESISTDSRERLGGHVCRGSD
jgi:hypothetical protein